MSGSLRPGYYEQADPPKYTYWKPVNCFWDGSEWSCGFGTEHPPTHESHVLPPSSFGPFRPTLQVRVVGWLHRFGALIAVVAVLVAVVCGVLFAGRLVDSIGRGGLDVLFFVVAMAAVHFLPTLIAVKRQVPHVASVAVINLFLGWTLVGWVVALAMAVRTND